MFIDITLFTACIVTTFTHKFIGDFGDKIYSIYSHIIASHNILKSVFEKTLKKLS
jgi:hypothetical protein